MFWFILAAVIAVGDLVIKYQVRKNVELNSERPVLKGKVIITKFYNPGAMLGILKEKTTLLLGISMLVIGIVIGMLLAFTGHKENFILKLGLSILLGGAASNVFERITDGKVTDYFRLSLGCKKLEKMIFNIGDFCIFIGAVMTVIAGIAKK